MLHINEMEWDSGFETWKIQSTRGSLLPSAIMERTWLIAISLRNPRFSNRWLRSAIRTAQRHRGRVVITLVDEPYASSIRALSVSRSKLKESLANLDRQKDQQLRRLELLVKHLYGDVQVITWERFCRATPDSLRTEIARGFVNQSSRVRRLVLSEVARVHPGVEDISTKLKLAQFFLEEAPVLINIYYAALPGVIDMYPGPQSRFFWDLDAGLLNNELPEASRLATSGPPHVYCCSI